MSRSWSFSFLFSALSNFFFVLLVNKFLDLFRVSRKNYSIAILVKTVYFETKSFASFFDAFSLECFLNPFRFFDQFVVVLRSTLDDQKVLIGLWIIFSFFLLSLVELKLEIVPSSCKAEVLTHLLCFLIFSEIPTI